MAPYQIFTDATADCSPHWLASLPPVGIVPMRVEIGGQEYTYGPSETISAEDFKRWEIMPRPLKSRPQYVQSLEPALNAG